MTRMLVLVILAQGCGLALDAGGRFSLSLDGGALGTGSSALAAEGDLFVLVHPTDAPPPGARIAVLGADGVEVARLPIPAEVNSPHALAFDGTSLWLSGFGDEHGGGGLFELDPSTGDVLSALPTIRVEGVAIDGDGLWIADGDLVRMTHDGTETGRRRGVRTVQDLAYDDGDVLVLTNGGPDTVTRVAPNGTRRVLEHAVTRNNMAYAMTVRGGELLVVDQALDDEELPLGTQVVRHMDPRTGELWSTVPLLVEGWVTALAPRSGT